MAYDPTIYEGAVPFYTRGRPPYSADLVATLRREVGLDGSTRVLDVGCGPGTVALELAPHVDRVVGLDPSEAMLAAAAEGARSRAVTNVAWVQGLAEDLPDLGPGLGLGFGAGPGGCSLVTFGQSFQWTERERVAEAVFDLLAPGGSVVCLAHTVEGRPAPAGPPEPGLPRIPHDAISRLVADYLGPRRRRGQGYSSTLPDRYEDALGRTRFGSARSVFAPGRPDVVRDVDGMVAGCLSMSWSAPHLFGERLPAFEADLRALLHRHSPTGRFWDWPGDTELVIATKPV
jgi:SAM-dependent methyltransferase